MEEVIKDDYNYRTGYYCSKDTTAYDIFTYICNRYLRGDYPGSYKRSDEDYVEWE